MKAFRCPYCKSEDVGGNLNKEHGYCNSCKKNFSRLKAGEDVFRWLWTTDIAPVGMNNYMAWRKRKHAWQWLKDYLGF